MDYTLIQLKESVKSVELLTTMYNDVASIDVDKDMEVKYIFKLVCVVTRQKR